MKRITILMGILLLATFAMAGEGYGGKHKKGKGGIGLNMPSMGMLERYKDSLSINDKQIDKLKEIRREAQDKLIDLKAARDKAHLKLKDALDDVNYSRALLEKVLDDVTEKMTAIKKHNIKMMLDMRDVLTPEQREEIRDKVRGFKNRMSGGEGKMRGR
jgi:Spy/CpxP family protein refolding chaperone